jgi:hypothetical protein
MHFRAGESDRLRAFLHQETRALIATRPAIARGFSRGHMPVARTRMAAGDGALGAPDRMDSLPI